MAIPNLPISGFDENTQQGEVSEEVRASAEISRQLNEQGRELAEKERRLAEDSRMREEDYRALAEAARTTAEELRQAHEQLRAIGEEARRAAEELRRATEISLKATYDQTAILQELRETMLRYESEGAASTGRPPGR